MDRHATVGQEPDLIRRDDLPSAHLTVGEWRRPVSTAGPDPFLDPDAGGPQG
jgi:hypothetical protein